MYNRHILVFILINLRSLKANDLNENFSLIKHDKRVLKNRTVGEN